MKKYILYAMYMVVGLALWLHVPLVNPAEKVELGEGYSPTFRTESTTISANAVHTAGNMGQEYDTGVYVIQIPNPSTSKPPVGTRTLYKCTAAGATLFVTSGSINESGTTAWTKEAGAEFEVTYPGTGVSVFVKCNRTFTRQ